MQGQHSPGKSNFTDKRGTNKAPQRKEESEKTVGVFFDAKTFIPARGYYLIEVRYIGSSTSIHIPDEVHAKQQYGIIRARGKGKHHFNGTIIEPEWEVGEFVYAIMGQGRKIEVEEKKLLVIGAEHILGKFPEVPQAVIDEFAREIEKGKKPEPTILDASNGNAQGNYPPGAP